MEAKEYYFLVFAQPIMPMEHSEFFIESRENAGLDGSTVHIKSQKLVLILQSLLWAECVLRRVNHLYKLSVLNWLLEHFNSMQMYIATVGLV